LQHRRTKAVRFCTLFWAGKISASAQAFERQYVMKIGTKPAKGDGIPAKLETPGFFKTRRKTPLI
jgi:hypothetical protein